MFVLVYIQSEKIIDAEQIMETEGVCYQDQQGIYLKISILFVQLVCAYVSRIKIIGMLYVWVLRQNILSNSSIAFK